MLSVEKDDPREAPESGDKKPQPVKNSIHEGYHGHRHCWWLFVFKGSLLMPVEMI